MRAVATILLTKTTAAQNEVAHSKHTMRGLYFQAVVFVRSIANLNYSAVLLYGIQLQKLTSFFAFTLNLILAYETFPRLFDMTYLRGFSKV